MPKLLCPTCHGGRRVSSGGKLYVCPTCGGAGGNVLGAPVSGAAAPVDRPDGASRASLHVTRRPGAFRGRP